MGYIFIRDSENKIYSFNTNFSPLDHQFKLVYSDNNFAYVTDYAVYNSYIFFSGYFNTQIDGIQMNSIALYKIGNGSTNGKYIQINGTTSPNSSFIFCLKIFGDIIYMGGYFTK